MPTLKKRINISLPHEIDQVLSFVAKRDDLPQATKALHLLTLALEIEEDSALNAIAKKRNTKHATFISHEDAWK